jgi:hypothetical protein
MINFSEYKLKFVDKDVDVVTMSNFLSIEVDNSTL